MSTRRKPPRPEVLKDAAQILREVLRVIPPDEHSLVTRWYAEGWKVP